ncbi:unnamed protein product [Brassica oleracea var. botrytis]|uniref:Uncharacterized protein n=1 Tax=Brassica oleracea TaxID=3712 RepID=A0A3P6ANW6_BRAOL|nr:unnamed protein product [Brassica oleracea]
MSEHRPFYDVTIPKFKVGSVTVEIEFTTIFYYGTAVGCLIGPYYTDVTTDFHLQVARVKNIFEFCYIITSSTDEEKLPSISFEMQGGAPYNVFSSIHVFDTSDRDRLFPEPSIREWLSRAWCEDYSVPCILAKAKFPANSFQYVLDVSLAMSDESVSETKATDQHEPPFNSLEPRYKISFILPSTPIMLPSPIHYFPL